jgi:hypothetical protein
MGMPSRIQIVGVMISYCLSVSVMCGGFSVIGMCRGKCVSGGVTVPARNEDGEPAAGHDGFFRHF